jgi:hypothetical protein
MAVFTRMTGQDFNLGDTALRRAMLAQVATRAPVHAYVGDHAADYVEALGLRAGDTAHASTQGFEHALAERMKASPVVVLEKPGAFRAAHRFGRYRERALLAAKVRRAGGATMWLGGGLQGPPRLTERLKMRTSAALAERVVWRDARTAAWFGCGEVMPDWAFALPPSGRPSAGRRRLAVSIRGDRPGPPPSWLTAAARWARGAGLEPVAVSQVRIDDDHARTAAAQMECEALTWGAETHLEQEQRVRDAYAGCAIVLSDRLHVLILAMIEGAVPACLLPVAEDKIDRHLQAAGYQGAAANVQGWPEARLGKALDHAMTRAPEAAAARLDAQERVLAVGADVRAVIAEKLGGWD